MSARRHMRLIVAAFAVATAILLLTAHILQLTREVTAQTPVGPQNPPPRPPWVMPDGGVDEAKIPDCVHAVGPNGRPLVDDDGALICVDIKARHRNMPLPPVPPNPFTVTSPPIPVTPTVIPLGPINRPPGRELPPGAPIPTPNTRQ